MWGCNERSPTRVLAMESVSRPVKTSIAIGSLLGLVMGASVAVAIDRGWLAEVVGESTPAASTPSVVVEPVPARTEPGDDEVHRPLRPGSSSYGMSTPSATRSRQS